MKKILLISILLCILTAQAQYVGTKPPKGTQLNRANSRARGLVGYWLMNEGGGNTVYDLSGNGNHGTITNATWTTGKYGSCLDFDGNGDDIETPAIIPVSGTIIIWHQYGFDTGASAADDYYLCGGDSVDTEVAFRWQTGQTRVIPYTDADAIGTYSPGTLVGWHQFVITWDSSAGKFYHNGVLELTESTDHTTSHTDNLIIGAKDAGGDTDCFLGQIDNVTLFNRALSQSEIQSLCADPFQLLGQPKELYVSAGEAPPAGNGQVIPIMITSASWWLAAIILMTMAGCYLKRKAA